MPKKKKYPKLPSGFGSIRYLGKGRAKPYAVHPPCKDQDPETGLYVRPKAICYVEDWYTGFGVLMAYKAGTYTPGDEKKIQMERASCNEEELSDFCKRLLKDHQIATAKSSVDKRTFADVYEEFYEWKFGEHAAKKLSFKTKEAYASGYRHLSALHDSPIAGLTINELQNILNSCPFGEASIEQMILCLKNVFKYALSRDYIQKDISVHVVKPQCKGDEHGVPFSIEDVKKLWQDESNQTAAFILVMCYSGFRISAYETLEVNLDEGYFQGGVKTKSGKNRIVPIHPYIDPLVRRFKNGFPKNFVDKMHKYLKKNGMEDHTPHDCRHTFSMLCEKYGVNERDRKRMLGHSFGADITNGIYGHRTLEDLKAEICKITLH